MLSPISPLLSRRAPAGIDAFDIVLRDGRPVLVSDALHTWDLRADKWTAFDLAAPWPPEAQADYIDMRAIGAVVVDGRVVVGGGGDHQGFAQWDLDSGAVRTYARRDHGGVATVATLEAAGRTLFIAGGTGPSVHVWDATRRDPLPVDFEDDDENEPIALDQTEPAGVAAGLLRGRPVAVTESDNTVLVWDLSDDEPETMVAFDEPNEDELVDLVGEVEAERLDWRLAAVTAVGLSGVAGRESVLAATGGVLLFGDPDTGLWDETLVLPGGPTAHLDAAVAGGRAVAVTGAEDGTVCLVDLERRDLVIAPFQAHEGEIVGVRVLELDGRPAALTVGRDDHVRAWPFTAP
ncbi:WD40 repeat domain-containing protein [Actinomadura napierensis]|uniref:WD40 repeat domain-containing protein n=1 Tax=Actinomadura napierensis TaxID=267854 RepID=A0ABN3AFN9_9ACTN